MISLTKQAEDRIRQLVAQTPSATGVLFYVVPGGCTGYSYKFELLNEDSDMNGCMQLEDTPLWFCFDQESLIAGIEIDWVTEGFNQHFAFNNPNQTATCGCGTSFAA